MPGALWGSGAQETPQDEVLHPQPPLTPLPWLGWEKAQPRLGVSGPSPAALLPGCTSPAPPAPRGAGLPELSWVLPRIISPRAPSCLSTRLPGTTARSPQLAAEDKAASQSPGFSGPAPRPGGQVPVCVATGWRAICRRPVPLPAAPSPQGQARGNERRYPWWMPSSTPLTTDRGTGHSVCKELVCVANLLPPSPARM